MIAKESLPKVYTLDSQVKVSQGCVSISVTRYTNSLVLIVNELGTLGSMLEGVLEGKGEEDIFEIKTLFGATDIVFYEVFFRRVVESVFKLCKLPPSQPYNITLFVALPVNRPTFSEKEYYSVLVGELEKQIPTLFPQN